MMDVARYARNNVNASKPNPLRMSKVRKKAVTFFEKKVTKKTSYSSGF